MKNIAVQLFSEVLQIYLEFGDEKREEIRQLVRVIASDDDNDDYATAFRNAHKSLAAILFAGK